jgi:enoyl-[acyl-carrier protein] reductase I
MMTMDIFCHSFVRMAELEEPLVMEGRAYPCGAQKVIPNYGLMGSVKVASQSLVRELVFELGSKAFASNAISAGPIKTRASSGLVKFGDLLLRTPCAALSRFADGSIAHWAIVEPPKA